jgi:hypothetical protein
LSEAPKPATMLTPLTTRSRDDLLKRVERWTQARKIRLCRGLCAEIIIASEVMLAHGLSQHEIDHWMEAYRRKDFEALKVGYRRKQRRRDDAMSDSGRESASR